MSTHLICIRENKKNIRTFGLKKSALFEAYVDTQTVQAVRTYSSSKKFWTKNLSFSYFSTKTRVVGTYGEQLPETLLMSNQNICFLGEIRKYLDTSLFSGNLLLPI